MKKAWRYIKSVQTRIPPVPPYHRNTSAPHVVLHVEQILCGITVCSAYTAYQPSSSSLAVKQGKKEFVISRIVLVSVGQLTAQPSGAGSLSFGSQSVDERQLPAPNNAKHSPGRSRLPRQAGDPSYQQRRMQRPQARHGLFVLAAGEVSWTRTLHIVTAGHYTVLSCASLHEPSLGC